MEELERGGEQKEKLEKEAKGSVVLYGIAAFLLLTA
jgi:hypothetical protein